MIPFLLAAMLTACGKPESTATATESEFGTSESLVAKPEPLKELRRQCKTDRASLGDELCNRVAGATNRQFMGDGKTPYTPPKEQPKL